MSEHPTSSNSPDAPSSSMEGPIPDTNEQPSQSPLDTTENRKTKGNYLKSVSTMGLKLGEIASKAAFQTGKVTLEAVTTLGSTIGHTARKTGQTMAETATDVGGAIAHHTAQAGQAAAGTAQWVGTSATRHLYGLAEYTTEGAGQVVQIVTTNPLFQRPEVQKVSGQLRLDWLLNMSDRVDLVKAQEAVTQLQDKYPDDSPSQIAHRIMVQKAIYAGGMGLFTSVVPGAAAALLAVDLAATTALQTEMVYQIAAAYGLDLADPARQGEVLAIFGLALGGGRAIRAGLGFVRNVPMAGAVIGASTNATMLYALGYAACRFYEAKTAAPTDEPNGEALDTIHSESEQYLEVAMSQQAIMDQILVHMVLASYPEKTWDDILPSLKSLHLHPDSLQAIATNLQSPQPLGALLDQLNRDFAVPLLAQCCRIARHDGEKSPQETELLDAIANRFDLDLDQLRACVNESDE